MTQPTASTRFVLGLSPDQRPAAQARERSVIIRGGPGSGRTHTLMGRAHHLLSQGEGPYALNVWLAHPYAAQDFRRRFAATSMDPADPPRISIGTLYKTAFRYLRLRGESTLGRSPDFTIWNRQRAAAEMERAARRVLPKPNRRGEPIRGEVVRVLNWYIRNRNRYRTRATIARSSAGVARGSRDLRGHQAAYGRVGLGGPGQRGLQGPGGRLSSQCHASEFLQEPAGRRRSGDDVAAIPIFWAHGRGSQLGDYRS